MTAKELLTGEIAAATTSHSQFSRRSPIHTKDHVDCGACDRARSEALLVITEDLSFAAAAQIWLDFCISSASPAGGPSSARYIRRNTEVSYRQYCESLALFFGAMPLNKVHFGNLREYQRCRIEGADPFIRRRRPHQPAASCPASAKKVNQELAVLRRILLMGGAWSKELEQFYRPLLEEPSEALRALEPQEQERWLNTAGTQKRWELVHWYSLLAIGTTMSTNELQHLRLGDVNLFHQTVTVAGAGVKCKGRKRSIALLTAEEMWAAEKLLERARRCGSVAPQDYLFPFRMKKYDWVPTKPMSTSGIKREWQEVREATGLLWFRQYDLRHTGGTRLAEAGWRPEMIKARMGHLTEKMRENYTHITEAAQRREQERVNTLRFAPRAVGREAAYSAARRVL